MPLLCSLARPKLNRRYAPLMRRASFLIGGVIFWTPGPTRITYTDQAAETSELGCRDLRPDGERGHSAISHCKFDAPPDRTLYESMHRAALSSRLLRLAAAAFLGTAR